LKVFRVGHRRQSPTRPPDSTAQPWSVTAYDCAGQTGCLGHSRPVNGAAGSIFVDARIALGESASASLRSAAPFGQPPTANAPAASAESARRIRTKLWIANVWGAYWRQSPSPDIGRGRWRKLVSAVLDVAARRAAAIFIRTLRQSRRSLSGVPPLSACALKVRVRWHRVSYLSCHLGAPTALSNFSGSAILLSADIRLRTCPFWSAQSWRKRCARPCTSNRLSQFSAKGGNHGPSHPAGR
jgi:hypothetical protein